MATKKATTKAEKLREKVNLYRKMADDLRVQAAQVDLKVKKVKKVKKVTKATKKTISTASTGIVLPENFAPKGKRVRKKTKSLVVSEAVSVPEVLDEEPPRFQVVLETDKKREKILDRVLNGESPMIEMAQVDPRTVVDPYLGMVADFDGDVFGESIWRRTKRWLSTLLRGK